jgi:hypothetical protein
VFLMQLERSLHDLKKALGSRCVASATAQDLDNLQLPCHMRLTQPDMLPYHRQDSLAPLESLQQTFGDCLVEDLRAARTQDLLKVALGTGRGDHAQAFSRGQKIETRDACNGSASEIVG